MPVVSLVCEIITGVNWLVTVAVPTLVDKRLDGSLVRAVRCAV